jgi:protein involved in polysaccharide export with SLBB domain
MRKNESVSTLLRYAGGFTGDAYTKSVRLTRQTGERYAVYNVSEFEQATFRLNDGDAVSVDGMLNRYEDMAEIKGAVFRPGQYHIGQDITTVRGLIEHAEGVTEDAYTAHAVLHRLKEDRSLKVIPVDVEGIMAGTVADIPLQNEDVLFIPTQEELRKDRILTITGEVMAPGDFEYADSTTIEDLIIQAGGLQDGASLARVDVSRRIKDPLSTKKTREIAETFEFDIRDGLVINNGRKFYLQPYDVVHVRRSPGFVMPRNIRVTGEVNFEGNFTIHSKKLRLTDAIQMAGGVTEDAYLHGARLMRRMNDVERQRMESTMFALQNMLNERGDSVAMSKLNMSDTYPVGIELDKALEKPGSDSDILLREGDEIVVPEYNGTVKISGDVMFPNTVTFEDGKKLKWYINKAGGYGQHAKKSRTFIVYQNGTVSKAKKGDVEPGCEILVPSKRRRDPLQFSQILTMGSSITTMVAMIAYMANLFK